MKQVKQLQLENYLSKKQTKFIYSTLESVPTDKESLTDSIEEFKSCMKQIGKSRNHFEFIDNCVDVVRRHQVATVCSIIGVRWMYSFILPSGES